MRPALSNRAVHKHYLSLADTRTLATMGPIGDPTGGPAYGERNAPAAAVILGGAQMYGAYAAAGSFAAMSVAQGLVFAGGAMQAVGGLTGNSDLMKLGAVSSLAGGIGGYLSDPGSGFNTKVAEVFSDAPAAPATTTPFAQGTNASMTTPPANLSQSQLSPLATGSVNPAQPVVPVTAPPPPAVAPAAAPAAAGAQSPGLIGQFTSYAKENPMAAMMMSQAAAGGLEAAGNILSGKSAAEADALEADTDYKRALAEKARADAQLEVQRRANLNNNLSRYTQPYKLNPNAVLIQNQA